ncbi:MAG: hypothetical protein NT077_00535, partial [Candidatus Taylorbacteria bacterium]|nr:hypothetical protein [Candidatus Taylorbacteria bacterium]
SISGVQTPLFSGKSMRVTYPTAKTRYLRISIVNDDNRPLVIASTALVEGPIVSAIFETRPGESYRLYYGNPSAYQPTYDIARISTYIETNLLPLATVGSESANSLYVAPAAPVIPYTESHRGLLNGLLVLIVIILAGGIGWYIHGYIKSHKELSTTQEPFVKQEPPTKQEPPQGTEGTSQNNL